MMGEYQAPWLENFFSCSTHKSMKFIIFINTKIQTDEAIFLLRTAVNVICPGLEVIKLFYAQLN